MHSITPTSDSPHNKKYQTFKHATCYFFACFIVTTVVWIKKHFGIVSIEQILFHLTCNTEDIHEADPFFFKSFLLWCIGLSIVLTITLMYFKQTYTYIRSLLKKNIHSSIIASIWKYITLHFPMIFLGMAFCFFSYQLHFISYLQSFHGKDFFATAYIDPNNVHIHKKHLKSLVMIYVESLEQTYSDERLFGTDLLGALKTFKNKSISFDDYEQMQGTTWTIAGIVATQCGIPLNRPIDNNAQMKDANFLASASCLGDILAKNGYHNVFMKGASLDFAGNNSFFKTHHYQSLYGKSEWIQEGEDPNQMNSWGLYDDDLFRHAKDKLHKLIEEDQLFNLTILTVDTHNPDGFLDKSCKQRGYEGFEGIVECTSHEVADFIHYIIDQGWLDRVNIVIQGDHLAAPNAVYEKLLSNPHRRVFNLLISNKSPIKNTNHITHFDMFPTILTFLGFQIDGGRLGIGYSAIGHPQATLPADRFYQLHRVLLRRSKTYLKLWEVHKHI